MLPTQFIPVLEQDFAFGELGFWILRRAMTEGIRTILREDADASVRSLQSFYFSPAIPAEEFIRKFL